MSILESSDVEPSAKIIRREERDDLSSDSTGKATVKEMFPSEGVAEPQVSLSHSLTPFTFK